MSLQLIRWNRCCHNSIRTMHDNRRDTYPIGCKSNAVAHNVDCQSGHMEMCHVRMSLRGEGGEDGTRKCYWDVSFPVIARDNFLSISFTRKHTPNATSVNTWTFPIKSKLHWQAWGNRSDGSLHAQPVVSQSLLLVSFDKRKIEKHEHGALACSWKFTLKFQHAMRHHLCNDGRQGRKLFQYIYCAHRWSNAFPTWEPSINVLRQRTRFEFENEMDEMGEWGFSIAGQKAGNEAMDSRQIQKLRTTALLPNKCHIFRFSIIFSSHNCTISTSHLATPKTVTVIHCRSSTKESVSSWNCVFSRCQKIEAVVWSKKKKKKK